jgi:nitrate/TMAO reductase-like tetraheme cytochrome c subunit
MPKKLCLLAFLAISGLLVAAGGSQEKAAQVGMAVFKDNNCVQCHARINEPLRASIHYYEWHLSPHEAKGVGCDKCHGGDPTATDKQKAHVGVLRSTESASRLHPTNQSATCGSCHQTVVNAFVQSAHYQRLQRVGLGPSCSTCHQHMALVVAQTQKATANLCASCHDSPNAVRPSPELPRRAGEFTLALWRAHRVIVWANMLVDNARYMGVRLDQEPEDLKRVEAQLRAAKVDWHKFDVDCARRQADEAFNAGTKVKDVLRKKLNPF